MSPELPMITLDRVSRVYGSGELAVKALRQVSLSVRATELVAIMGPSGSGKSTLLNLAGGLDVASSGSVVINGTDTARLSRRGLAELRRRSVGLVFQDFNLVPALTAAENVALPLELDGSPARKARKQALEALEQVGVAASDADRFPDQLSGGQRQRLAIARALIGDRQVILADEPAGALDTEGGDAILAVIRDRCDAGAAGILVTHDARHAAWADRVIFLRDGSIVDPAAEHSGVERLLSDVL
jgi:putative ABC transport system ATP-binding protein